MLIRSYFTVKKRDVLEGKLEKVNCSCFHGGSVKAELQRITGVKRTTDGEGGSTEKIGALTTKSPSKIRRRLGSTQRKVE